IQPLPDFELLPVALAQPEIHPDRAVDEALNPAPRDRLAGLEVLEESVIAVAGRWDAGRDRRTRTPLLARSSRRIPRTARCAGRTCRARSARARDRPGRSRCPLTGRRAVRRPTRRCARRLRPRPTWRPVRNRPLTSWL